MKKSATGRFAALKVAASALALTVAAGWAGEAAAQSRTVATGENGVTVDETLHIVANHQVPIGVGGNPQTGSQWALSPWVMDPAGINGIGQQIAFIQTSPTAAGLSLCSGTLINPRTVITAAHCVYNNPAHMYGSETGTGGGVNGAFGPGGAIITSQGIPYSFGFSSTNRCIGPTAPIPAAGGASAYPTGNGCAVGTGPYEQWRDSGFQTIEEAAIYNANQVWYNRNAQPVALGGGGEFANGDIAIVTLDTHAKGIPTWTLLFSPLDGPAHAIVTGYGGTGVGLSGVGSLAGIDYRRRSAENMIDALMTAYDWANSPAMLNLLAPGQLGANQHSIYWLDFDDPDFAWDSNNVPANFFFNTSAVRNNGYYDFNGLGGIVDGRALPNEGATAGGDSGGPLIVDQRFDRPVVAGVLTGSYSFNGGLSTYGQFNVYPPLFLFWEEIVTQNPYRYVENKNGNRDWTNPNHWVQVMDPNYAIIGPDGNLLNSLPDTPQGGGDGAVEKFGETCFFELSCSNISGPGNPVGSGTPLIIPGGPGSTNFVPNNVEPLNSADPLAHRWARYYDVTLNGIGETRVTTPITIDRLTVDGLLTSLDVRAGGTLNVWSDANFVMGIVNVDGTLNTGEALVVHALLSGRGTFNPTYLTSVNGAIAPGGIGSIGTLTVRADTILASNSELLVELGNNVGDRLAVTGDADTTGIASLGGDLWLTPVGTPRQNQTFTVVTAAGGIDGTFDAVRGFVGVLRPQVTYGANSVTVKLKAGSILDLLLHNPALAPIAYALDQLRENHYSSLYDLYGTIDLMDRTSLTRALGNLTPRAMLDANALVAMQGSAFGNTLQDRMALLSRHGGGGLSVMGSPQQVLAFGGDSGLSAAGELAFASRMTDNHTVSAMPNGMSAFFTGGYDESRSSAVSGRTATGENDGMRTWHVIGGVEHTMGAFTMGVAGGYSRGESMQMTGTQADNEVSQTAFYGVYRFGNGAYVSGMAGMGASRVNTERRFAEGHLDYRMNGDVGGEIFLASFEAGVNYDLANGLIVTPNIGVDHYNVTMDGFAETGGNEAALNVGENVYEMMEARLGLRMEGDFDFVNGWSFTPSFDASVVANLGGDEGGVWANFIAAPDVPFFIPGQGRDDSWGEINAGFRLVRGDTSIGFQAETSVGRQELYEDRYTARIVQKF